MQADVSRVGVAAEIRAEAARQQLTQQAIARRTGRSVGWVADRLREIRPVSADDLRALAAAIGLTAAELERRAAVYAERTIRRR